MNIASISTGDYQTFFLLTNGSLFGMGLNLDSQLGLVNLMNFLFPTFILSNISSISIGKSSSIAVSSSGDILGWGNNTVI
jgi:alpha-tubulin suppressor-like RCC1 family protein